MRDSAGVHLGKEAGSGLQDTWQHMDAHHTPCLDLKHVCEVPGLQGTNSELYQSTCGLQESTTIKKR
jgi:hypothetical protein